MTSSRNAQSFCSIQRTVSSCTRLDLPLAAAVPTLMHHKTTSRHKEIDGYQQALDGHGCGFFSKKEIHGTAPGGLTKEANSYSQMFGRILGGVAVSVCNRKLVYLLDPACAVTRFAIRPC